MSQASNFLTLYLFTATSICFVNVFGFSPTTFRRPATFVLELEEERTQKLSLIYFDSNVGSKLSRAVAGRWRSELSMAVENNTLEKVPEDDDTAIPFVDVENNSYIECYADSIAIVDGVEYTIGSPCDYSVALCYFDKDNQLLPIELDEELMDDVFPVAESIVEEEFGEELSLQRTPQTLTIVGELVEEDEDEEEDEDDIDDDEEEVEILLSFEHKGVEYNLVRLLDPVLLVGKSDPDNVEKRILLTPEESNEVMPILEDLFLEYQQERDSMTF